MYMYLEVLFPRTTFAVILPSHWHNPHPMYFWMCSFLLLTIAAETTKDGYIAADLKTAMPYQFKWVVVLVQAQLESAAAN